MQLTTWKNLKIKMHTITCYEKGDISLLLKQSTKWGLRDACINW